MKLTSVEAVCAICYAEIFGVAVKIRFHFLRNFHRSGWYLIFSHFLQMVRVHCTADNTILV